MSRSFSHTFSIYFDAASYLCGDGYDITVQGLKTLVPMQTPYRLRMQSGYSTAIVALRLYESGVSTSDREIVPVYLRPCQAERERLARLEAQSGT